MSMKRNDSSVLDELDGTLRRAVESARSIAPPDVSMQQSLARIEELIESKALEVSIRVMPVLGDARVGGHVNSSLRLRWLAGLAASAAVMLIGFIIMSRPTLGFAEVAQELAKQEWVHVTEELTDGTNSEVWFSPRNDVSARRDAKSIEFRDHRTGVFHWYEKSDRELFRVLEGDSPRRYDRFAELAATLPLLLENGAPTDPLTSVKFLEAPRDELQLISQSTSRVNEEGRELLDYEVKVRYRAQPARFFFRVDAETKLPQRCTVSVTVDGKEVKYGVRFDYPRQGPIDIYALGVPRDAVLVDRVPANDVKSLIASVTAVWGRFDDYRAVVVRYEKNDPYWWLNADVEVIHRKGDRMRRDILFRQPLPEHQPSDEVDFADWWIKQSKNRRGSCTSIRHGDINWMFESRLETADDGGQIAVIESKQDYELPIPAFWSLAPDYAARPPMGGSSLNNEMRVIANPSEGPSGTLLLEDIQTNSYNTAPSADDRNLMPHAWRKWIDAGRESLVMRSDMYDSQGNLMSSRIVVQAAQSPAGHWYPTELLDKWRTPSGEIGETVWHFYVDFAIDIPDALFNVENPPQLN